jgi:hypothetical protein
MLGTYGSVPEPLCYSRKVADSRPDKVIVISVFFTLPNPSSRHVALGQTPLLTGMTTRNLSRNEALPARKADNITAISETIFQKTWKPRRGLHYLLQEQLYFLPLY